jgi:hypothetical protein
MSTSSKLIAVLLLLALAVAAWFGWRPSPPPSTPVATAQPEIQPSVEEPAASDSEPRHPIEAAGAASAPADLSKELMALFGQGAVHKLFELDDFPHRFVATVDNLGRVQASPHLWPMVPVAGRFSLVTQGGRQFASPANAARYEPYVQLLDGLDLPASVALYRRLYPDFQRAYAELGYPKGYFNDRFVEVIDLLLATPEPTTLPAMHLPAADGPIQPSRPWLLYEFDDPALQSLSSGQRILLRMGGANERRVKARLKALRSLITTGAPRS